MTTIVEISLVCSSAGRLRARCDMIEDQLASNRNIASELADANYVGRFWRRDIGGASSLVRRRKIVLSRRRVTSRVCDREERNARASIGVDEVIFRRHPGSPRQSLAR